MPPKKVPYPHTRAQGPFPYSYLKEKSCHQLPGHRDLERPRSVVEVGMREH